MREFRVEPQGLFIPPGLKPVSKYKRRELFATVPKLLMRFVAPHPIAAVDLQGYVHCNTVYAVVLARPSLDAYAVLACLLNSRPVRWWFAPRSTRRRGFFRTFKSTRSSGFPFPASTTAVRRWLACVAGRAAAGGRLDREAIEAACLAAFGLKEW